MRNIFVDVVILMFSSFFLGAAGMKLKRKLPPEEEETNDYDWGWSLVEDSWRNMRAATSSASDGAAAIGHATTAVSSVPASSSDAQGSSAIGQATASPSFPSIIAQTTTASSLQASSAQGSFIAQATTAASSVQGSAFVAPAATASDVAMHEAIGPVVGPIASGGQTASCHASPPRRLKGRPTFTSDIVSSSDFVPSTEVDTPTPPPPVESRAPEGVFNDDGMWDLFNAPGQAERSCASSSSANQPLTTERVELHNQIFLRETEEQRHAKYIRQQRRIQEYEDACYRVPNDEKLDLLQ